MNIVELEYENIQLRDENQKLINENKVLKHKLGETQIDLAMKEIQSRVPKIELNVSPNSPNADQIALIVQENMRLRCENRQLNQMNIHLKIEINDLKYRLKTVEADQKELKETIKSLKNEKDTESERQLLYDVISKYYDYFLFMSRSDSTIMRYVCQTENNKKQGPPKIWVLDRIEFFNDLNRELDMSMQCIDFDLDFANPKEEQDNQVESALAKNEFKLLRAMFRFNSDAFRLLLKHQQNKVTHRQIHSLPEIFNLDYFKEEFNKQIKKLEIAYYKSACNSFYSFFQ